jgi:glycosyltransferase involved in cell wall biosynthesis
VTAPAVKVALHVDQLWFAAPGGIGTYVRELLRELPGGGADVVPFWASQRAAPPVDRVEPTPVEVPGSIRRLYPSWALAGRPSLPGAFADRDVIHATNHAAVPPARSGQGLVVTIHDLAFDEFPQAFPRDWRWLYRLGVRAAARRADVLLTPSASTASDLQTRYGVRAERIRVTPLAGSLPVADVDVDRVLERLRIPRPYVVCPATLEPRKNQARLVRAYRQAAPDLPHALVLAGPDGWGVAEIEAEIGRGGPGRVHRTGLLRGVDLDAVLRGADLVVYPSRYEGFGLPIVEAMQRGVPVVTSTAPACAETAGDAAVLVDPEDVGGLADAIARVLGDRALHADLAARGRDRAAGFSWATTARATLDGYRLAVERAREAAA